MMSERCSGGRGKGGGDRSAKWSTLRNAFRSAVAASKSGGDAQGGGGERYTTSEGDPPARFEGFVLFPRCALEVYIPVVGFILSV